MQRIRLECRARQSNSWVAMQVETKFLRLFKPAALGVRIDDWRVCWIGGWDKCRVLFVVMVERPRWGAALLPVRDGAGSPEYNAVGHCDVGQIPVLEDRKIARKWNEVVLEPVERTLEKETPPDECKNGRVAV
jgi:hypothetical protein